MLATGHDWLLTALIAPGGALVARRLNVPAGTLMGPMVLAGGLTLAGVDFVVPPVVRELAFALIGLQVGLRFTIDTVRQMGRLLVPVLLGVIGLLVACFGLAVRPAPADRPLAARRLPRHHPRRDLRRAGDRVRHGRRT